MAGVAFAVEGDGVGFATESYAASALYTTLANRSGARWRIKAANNLDSKSQLRRASKVKKAVRKTKGKSVFVVHGRDEALRKSMFDFLRALGLLPLEWDHALKQARSKGATHTWAISSTRSWRRRRRWSSCSLRTT
jgi:hypothetical protein